MAQLAREKEDGTNHVNSGPENHLVPKMESAFGYGVTAGMPDIEVRCIMERQLAAIRAGAER